MKEVDELHKQTFLSMENFYQRLLMKLNSMKCNCEHTVSIKQYQRSILVWRTVTLALATFLVCLLWFIYGVGFSHGSTGVFASKSGCSSEFFHPGCKVAY